MQILPKITDSNAIQAYGVENGELQYSASGGPRIRPITSRARYVAG